MLEQIVLGTIQGIAEWLPISSEGLIILIKSNFFGQTALAENIRQALFLHLGTFLAALIYFRKDVVLLVAAVFNFKKSNLETKKLFWFLISATLISGILGFALLKVFSNLEEQLFLSAKVVTLVIGLLLLLTGWLQLRAKTDGVRQVKNLNGKDGILLGIIQGFSALPGLSRSGLTVSALLLKRFDGAAALRISFLMSLPIVLAGNIVLNFGQFNFSQEALAGLAFSFVFGILTIGALLKLARRINFGYFILVFGILVVISVFV